MAEVVKVNRERSVFSTKKKEWVSSDEVSFSVSTTSYNANKYAKIIRSHWVANLFRMSTDNPSLFILWLTSASDNARL